MSYKKLEIWQLARELVIAIHRMTLEELPKFELYEEGSQIRRSIKSVKSTIVEGYGRRRYKAEFIRFLLKRSLRIHMNENASIHHPAAGPQHPGSRIQHPASSTQYPGSSIQDPASSINVCVLTGYGLNCDHETAYAFELAGACGRRVHINSLIDGTETLDEFQMLAFIGGFSWADDHGAGVIQAVRMKTNIGEQILDFVQRGNLVIGICNGFQTLVNLGLLPGFGGDYRTRSVAVTYNDCGRFRDDWVHLKVNTESPCVFTRGFEHLEFPIRHGEGKFFAAPEVMEKLAAGNQIVLQYAHEDGRPAGGRFPANPNGSLADVAGICDSTGRVFGLMPHPEAFNHPTNHPDWTRQKALDPENWKTQTTGLTPGIRLLKNGVDFLKNKK